MSIALAVQSSTIRRIFAAQILGRTSKYVAQAGLAIALYRSIGTIDVVGWLTLMTLLVAAAACPLTATALSRWSVSTLLRLLVLCTFGLLLLCAALLWSGIDSPWLYILAAAVVSGASTASSTALQDAETDAVDTRAKAAANGLAAWSQGIPRLIGLSAGAAFGLLVHPAVLVSATALIFAGIVLFIPHVRSHEGPTGLVSPWSDVRNGFRALWRAKPLRSAVLVLLAVCVALVPLEYLMPAVSGRCGLSPNLLFASLAIGGLAGGVVVMVLQHRQVRFVESLALSAAPLAMLVLAFHDHMAALCGAMLILGLAWELTFATMRHRIKIANETENGAAAFRLMTLTKYLIPAFASLALASAMTAAEVGC